MRVKSYYGIGRSKTSYLIQRRHIACSLASVRVTSSVCQPVQGSRLDVTVRWHSYGDISSLTTYCHGVAAALQLVLFSSRLCRPSCAITQPERSRHLKRPSPYTITNARRVACNNAHLNAPILLRNIFVSVNMEFFCRINNKPRNALRVMLDCSQYGTSRFKKYRRCHSLCA